MYFVDIIDVVKLFSCVMFSLHMISEETFSVIVCVSRLDCDEELF